VLDLVQPVGACKRFVNQAGELRLDPTRRLRALWQEHHIGRGAGDGPFNALLAPRTPPTTPSPRRPARAAIFCHAPGSGVVGIRSAPNRPGASRGYGPRRDPD